MRNKTIFRITSALLVLLILVCGFSLNAYASDGGEYSEIVTSEIATETPIITVPEQNENDKPIMMTIKSAQHGKATFVGMKDKDLAPIVVNVGETHTIIARKMGKRSLPVVSAKNDIVEFDTNHRLAGKALNFNIELLEVEE